MGRTKSKYRGGMIIESRLNVVMILLGCALIAGCFPPVDKHAHEKGIAWILLVQGGIFPDAVCVNDALSSALADGATVAGSTATLFRFPRGVNGSRSNITVQQNGCHIHRVYQYCDWTSHAKVQQYVMTPAYVSCNDANGDPSHELTGNGTSQACDLTFPGTRMLVSVAPSDIPLVTCNFTIQLQQL